jgi:hypothetical protein
MATLVLTTVGTALGGPIGGALGALLGQSIDQRLFAPAGRSGPRLSDLRVQSSSYGSTIPRLYGTMRVAGTVIWATDLVERRAKQSNGKGRPATTTYSYSASFAVALSARVIRSIGRIWAEGNILRGAAGDFKSATGFRVHDGGEDQAADPLIAAAEGAAHCPAYRGLAYVVFEDMDLSPFGNRIPSLSFEVVADNGAVSMADVAGDMLGRWAAFGSAPMMQGCVLAAASRGEAIEPLLAFIDADRPAGVAYWMVGRGEGAEVALLPADPADDAPQPRSETRYPASGQLPTHIAISSYDPARDHQMSVQQCRVVGGQGSVRRIAIPAALSAGASKALAAEIAMEMGIAERSSDWPSGFAALATQPGMQVALGAGNAPRMIEQRRIEGAAVHLTLGAVRSPAFADVVADGGRALAAPDAMIGASVGALFDLPHFGDAPMETARLVLAAAGTGAGWRSAAVELTPQADAMPVPLGAVGPMAVMGSIESVSGSGTAMLVDQAGIIIVQLLHDGMVLTNADDADVLGGANLAVAGGELLQFGRAQPLGNGRWALSRLLRGRFGTEDSVAALAPGARFALIDDPALLPIPAQSGFADVVPGGQISLMGMADAMPVLVPITQIGRALRPLPVSHIRGEWQGDGGLRLHWVRRSRGGFGWADGRDVPLDTPDERYTVVLSAGAVQQVQAVTVAQWALSAAEVAALRAGALAAGGAAGGAAMAVQIVQHGPRGDSLPVAQTLQL